MQYCFGPDCGGGVAPALALGTTHYCITPREDTWCYVDNEKVDVSNLTYQILNVKNEGVISGDNVTVTWGASSRWRGLLDLAGSHIHSVRAQDDGRVKVVESTLGSLGITYGAEAGLNDVEMEYGYALWNSKVDADGIVVAGGFAVESGSTGKFESSKLGGLYVLHNAAAYMDRGELRVGFTAGYMSSLKLIDVFATTHSNSNWVANSDFIMEGGQLIAGKGDFSYVNDALRVINSTALLDGVEVKGEIFVEGQNADTTLDQVTLVTDEYAISNNGTSLGRGAGIAVSRGARLEMNGGSITTLPPNNGDAIHVFKTGTASFNEVQIQSQRRGLWIYENAAATFNGSNITADAEVFLFSRGSNAVTMNDSTARSKARAVYTKDGHNDVLDLINSTLEGDAGHGQEPGCGRQVGIFHHQASRQLWRKL